MIDDEYTGSDDLEPRHEEPLKSEPYLAMIKRAQSAYADWQDRCANIERKYAHLAALSSTTSDRKFQLFWANMEVIRPTIYQRPPVPAVAQRFKTPNPVARQAAEILQRVLSYDVEDDDLHDTLKAVRDDLAIVARGVAWVLDSGACIHVDRQDFVHEPARKWSEVSWVARRAYLTRDEMYARFPDVSLVDAHFSTIELSEDAEGKSTDRKAEVWELWHKHDKIVVWVTEGIEDVLDMQPPLVDVRGFFPCPMPAYGTLEPRTLMAVPDYAFYRDQLDEIDELTARIAALSEALRLKGFYASGRSEVGEAIEAALKETSNSAILVPVSSLAALGGNSLRDSIVWMPITEVAQTISALIDLRKQLIQDVYEISGLSDIMRGQTDASETATAQNLKAQYGSVRISDKQAEMVRIARDILRIKAEIFAETAPAEMLAQIAQVNLPSVNDLMAAQQAGQEVDPATVTIEAVGDLLANQRVRPFVLDVESDSTISPNEAEEKAARTEFVQVIGGFIQQAGAMVAQEPGTATLAVELMKFAAGAFRAGRELEPVLDDFGQMVQRRAQEAEQMRNQPPQPTPEQQAALAKAETDRARVESDARIAEADAMIREQKALAEISKMRAEILKIQAEIANMSGATEWQG